MTRRRAPIVTSRADARFAGRRFAAAWIGEYGTAPTPSVLAEHCPHMANRALYRALGLPTSASKARAWLEGAAEVAAPAVSPSAEARS